MKFLKSDTLDNSSPFSRKNKWNLIYSFKKNKFKSRKLLIEVFIACMYAFGLGYSLYFLENPLKVSSIFIVILLISSLLIIIPHELIHTACYANKNTIFISYNLSKLKFNSYIKGTISKKRILILLILPFIIFSIIPSIIIYVFGFNLFLYAIATANAVKCGGDLLNFIFIIKNAPKKEYLKIDEYGIYLKAIPIK